MNIQYAAVTSSDSDKFNDYSFSKHLISVACTKDSLIQEKSDIEEQLRNIGYDVEDRKSLLDSPEDGACLEIIVTDFSGDTDNKLAEFSESRKRSQRKVPIVFFSTKEGFRERHKAVKHGGSAFLLSDNDEMSLVDTLSSLLPHKTEITHVVLVDDDEDLSAYYQIILEQSGIKVSVANNSEDALKALKNGTVDLVLLDLNMPDCNGFEFAAMLRQLTEYTTLPIIFMSTEMNIKKVIAQNEVDVDGFLVKPFTDDLLVSTVSHKISRFRSLNKIMQRDSATQLLNHTAFKKELSLEVHRATRRGTNFSYVLLDLDNFKHVNDTYGHAAGDVVIKALSHILKSRLRITDIIGRYGGEEFGVILLDTPADMAKVVLRQLLDKFSVIPFLSGEEKFFVTFSAGIAEFRAFPEFAKLSKAADEALYLAKGNGRNQIVIAYPPGEKTSQ